jgi:PAS domain S-box-containing protein
MEMTTESSPHPEAEGLFWQAVEAIPHALLLVDGGGRIVFVNPEGERLFGYRRGELLGQPVDGLVPEQFRGKHAAARAAFAADPRSRLLGTGRDLYGLRQDGSEFPAEVGLSPLRTDGGGLVLCAVVDITQRKQAEAEAEARARDLEALLYVTSHNLREPLRSIISFSQMVYDRYADKLDAKGQDFLRRTVRAAERLDRLLEDILTLSRAQRAVQPGEEVKAAEVVADALRQLGGRVREAGARVRVADDLPHLRADRRWAAQAVYNLLSNALKFTRAEEAPEVEVVAYQPAAGEPAGPGLVVRDRGPGVAPEHAERIFQLFQRAVGQEVEGTGAGLAIVRQVAERHGGAAWVRPREGGGSEFIITFGPGRRP